MAVVGLVIGRGSCSSACCLRRTGLLSLRRLTCTGRNARTSLSRHARTCALWHTWSGPLRNTWSGALRDSLTWATTRCCHLSGTGSRSSLHGCWIGARLLSGSLLHYGCWVT